MDKELEIGISFISKETKINYVNDVEYQVSRRHNEVFINKEKIQKCPRVNDFLSALYKRVERGEIFRLQKHTVPICILLLASLGYSVRSITLNNISDAFIERCWQCIQTIFHNITDPIKSWLKESMGTRNPRDYSLMFCQAKPISSSIQTIKTLTNSKGEFLNIDIVTSEFPNTIWHRDDAVINTMRVHIDESILL